jgi:DNA (cytosine-5)-methyltransferase 1
VRLLAAGVPCQPFSLAGRHLAANDERNLFPEVFRAVRELRPSAVFIENVRGLLRPSLSEYFEYLLLQLQYPSIGPENGELWSDHYTRLKTHQETNPSVEYQAFWESVNAADYGVPQVRNRVFIVTVKAGLKPYSFPARTHSKLALLERQGLKATTDSALESKLLPWVTTQEAIDSLLEPANDAACARMNHWSLPHAKSYAGHTGSRLDWPAKTVKAGVHGVPGGENSIIDETGAFRYMTLRELARVQTVPDNHWFDGARLHVTRQLGNAVPCELVETFARPLWSILNEPDEANVSGPSDLSAKANGLHVAPARKVEQR